MIKIGHASEVDKLVQLPHEVKDVIKGVADILDYHYGADRNIVENMGGYIVVITKEEELYELRNDNIDVWESYPEYVDRIAIKEGNEEMGDWTNSLIICNNDFGISIIMPMSITPQNFIDDME